MSRSDRCTTILDVSDVRTTSGELLYGAIDGTGPTSTGPHSDGAADVRGESGGGRGVFLRPGCPGAEPSVGVVGHASDVLQTSRLLLHGTLAAVRRRTVSTTEAIV
jgi:hypothetical protein